MTGSWLWFSLSRCSERVASSLRAGLICLDIPANLALSTAIRSYLGFRAGFLAIAACCLTSRFRGGLILDGERCLLRVEGRVGGSSIDGSG